MSRRMMPVGPMMIEHRLIEPMIRVMATDLERVRRGRAVTRRLVEDKHFFLPVMELLSQQEKDAMLAEGFELDQRLVHGMYREVVEQAEDGTSWGALASGAPPQRDDLVPTTGAFHS